MSYIQVRLLDLSIILVPLELISLIPNGSVILTKQTSKGSLPGYADVSPKGKDPFGLKKPIPSSNKKC